MVRQVEVPIAGAWKADLGQRRHAMAESIRLKAILHLMKLITTSGSVPFRSVPDRSGFSCIPSMHPGLTIDATGMAITASLVGDQGWRSIHPEIAIGASRDGNRRIREDDRSIPGWRSFHPGMASRDRARCITEWRSPGWHSRDGDQAYRDGDRCILGWRSLHP